MGDNAGMQAGTGGGSGGNGIAYQVVLVAHVLAAVLATASIFVTGGYARLARLGQGSEAVRRYFRPGPNLAARLLWAVPVLGLAVAGLGPTADLGQPWLWASSGLWALAGALATGVLWPAEARIQALVAGAPETPTLERASRRAARAAAAIDVAMVGAFVLMIGRPGL